MNGRLGSLRCAICGKGGWLRIDPPSNRAVHPECRTVADAARILVEAADRMRDRWAEATPDVRDNDLWRPLHDAADSVRQALGE